jgi:hypothetical protein
MRDTYRERVALLMKRAGEWLEPLATADRLTACLDTIERRLEEGYAPGMPWSNEEMALGIVREERANAGRLGDRGSEGGGEGGTDQGKGRGTPLP